VNLTALRVRTATPRFLERFPLAEPHWRLAVMTGQLEVIDPFALAQVGSSTGKTAAFIRRSGVVSDLLRRPLSAPILEWRRHIVLPTSAHLDPAPDFDQTVRVLSPRVHSESGYLAFFEPPAPIMPFLARTLEAARAQGLACRVSVTPGSYELCYEEHESYRHGASAKYREFFNVVLRPT
jgi:hypothetical protein